jgi:hypothetical protein
MLKTETNNSEHVEYEIEAKLLLVIIVRLIPKVGQ